MEGMNLKVEEVLRKMKSKNRYGMFKFYKKKGREIRWKEEKKYFKNN